ncbi:WD40/YVTN/BNR-like repeat-containing protein [Streptomyces sp. NPDC058770]|uniref:WD40/YVTN/BNR-like repeat-containing protein n=1 Tax=Streptomyces sp. NPDC058770 TaxID=3346631 RepID=UPI0036C32E67
MRAEGTTRRLMSWGLCVASLAAALAAPEAAAAPEVAARNAGVARGTAATPDPEASPGERRPTGERPVWTLTATGTDARFRGLAAVSRRTAWVAGSRGTVLRTTDGGRHWHDVSPPGAAGEGLEFRDIEAFDARRAVALSIGEGEASRVLRTDDGGATWTESFRNTDARAFYDCLTFFDRRHGLAMSDPVDGKYRVLSTEDGGRNWRVLPTDGMPRAQEGEAAFAASGQCLVASGPKDVWLATGGAATARVLHSADRGRTWAAVGATIPAGDPARGVFGLAFRDRHHGIAVGGDYRAGQPSPDAAAVTGDGGGSWRRSVLPPAEYRSGVAWLPHSGSHALAVGPTGTDLTPDGGRTWRTVDTGSYDTVDCTPDGGCWAAGEQGRVARSGT